MRIIFIIHMIIMSLGLFSQTTGYVLRNLDSTITLPDNSLTISKIIGLQTSLSSKSTLTGSEVITNKTFGAFNVGIDAGANDSYSITLSPAPTSYTNGMIVIFKANTQNTTACSINVNGLGVKSIVKRVNTTPATGDILALMWCMLVYDGTNFVLLNPIVN